MRHLRAVTTVATKSALTANAAQFERAERAAANSGPLFDVGGGVLASSDAWH
jgi:hypothetical protein